MPHDKYTITKRITLPIGHRLSKHLGKCINFHGHNFQVLVSVSTMCLNENDMVIDFSFLKSLMMDTLDKWDHSLLVNEKDPIANDVNYKHFKIITLPVDPTAEVMAKKLYDEIFLKLKDRYRNINIDDITIYENENSSVRYQIVP